MAVLGYKNGVMAFVLELQDFIFKLQARNQNTIEDQEPSNPCHHHEVQPRSYRTCRDHLPGATY